MLVDGVEVPDEKTPEVEFEDFFNTALETPLPGEEEVKPVEGEKVKPVEGEEEVKPEEETPEAKAERKAAKKAAREAETPEEKETRRAEKEAADAVEKATKDEEKEQRRIEKKTREAAAVAAALSAKVVTEIPKGPTPEELKQTAEEDAVLAEYEKNWEDHAKAQKINNKRLLSEVEKIFNQVVAPLVQKIPGIEQTIATSAQDKALGTVLGVHADAVELIPSVDAWIGTLPKYLQKAASETLDGGSPADVIELYNDFKEATGRTKEVTKPAEKEIAKPEENKRVLSLVSPKSSRTGVAASVDPGDFDGAFAEAMKVI